MTPDEVREHFRRFDALVGELRARRCAAAEAAQARFETIIREAALEKLKADKKKPPKWLDHDKAFKMLGDGAAELGRAGVKVELAEVERIEQDEKHARNAVRELAPRAAVYPGDEEHVVDTCWKSSYSSQGGSAITYARGSLLVVPPSTAGFELVPWEVRATETGFELVVRVREKIDAKILGKRPQDVRAWVKACWGVGCNPRVFNPIPHGYEESVGLDHFGGELATRRA